ncbi:MAG: ATP-binding cassette domain-containing protein [Propionibacteriaceae bacterium]|jgi:ABC-2 type transport system ATP-binding protein|nr:ATP-binding cassette domain-containing protein [Propionibacteriaceae bacterium]
MIVFDHLTKRYGPLVAVDDLSFSVEPGKVTGFLGPNGAGKTTTLRMATALIRPDAGTVSFDGRPYAAIPQPGRHIGIALEPNAFHPGRTALNHLLMLAPYVGADKKRCEEVLGFVGLGDATGKRVGKFSLGMRGRLNLAAAILGDPEVLLLDEPVNGLDPEGIRWIRQFMRALAESGRTVLTSSHLLSEVQQTVDNVVIIAHGKLVHSGSLATLEAGNVPRTIVSTRQRDALISLAQFHHWRVSAGTEPHSFLIEGPSAGEIGAAAGASHIILDQLASQSSDLEAVFLHLTEGQGGMR